MVYDRFIHRSALFVTLSFGIVASATHATAQQPKKETKQAQPEPAKQAVQNRETAKAKKVKPTKNKAKIKPKPQSPTKAPPAEAKTNAKRNPKKDAPVRASAKKPSTLSKSKQADEGKKATESDRAKAAETKKAKTVASGAKPGTRTTKAIATRTTPEKAETKKDAQIGLKEAIALLDSAESEKVKRGLKYLEAIGKPTITAPIVARLQQGLPPALVQLAIDALVKAKNARAAKVLFELCDHRRAAIRASAISALGSLKVTKAYSAVRDALDDPDASVRAAAAEALSQVGGRKALKDLYLVFESGNTDVVKEIAKWVTTRDAEKLTGYLKDHSFGTLQPAFVKILNTKSTSVREKTKLISRLGEVGTPDIQQFLRDYLNDLPKVGQKPLMDAIGKALSNSQKPEAAVSEPEVKQNNKSASKEKEAK